MKSELRDFSFPILADKSVLATFHPYISRIQNLEKGIYRRGWTEK